MQNSVHNPILDIHIEYVIRNKASDLHLSSGNYPMVRIDGEITPIKDTKIIDGIEIMEILNAIMNDKQKDKYQKEKELDFSIKTRFGGHRFRVNAFLTINGPAAVFREISSKALSLSELNAPEILAELCKLEKGLILVTGPTGSGKSTTLTAMVNNINDNYKRHIITVEDPIEFVYKSHNSLINQREVGSTTNSFPNALKSAMREDPDVIMVGEMRDLETIGLALTAAETGHLVIGTLHTNSAAQSVNRIIDVFPSDDKSLVRSMLSSSLKAIISQRLVKKKGGGRAAVYEILIATTSIKNLIREDQIPQINSMIEIGSKKGMVTAKASIMALLNSGTISEKTAESLLKSDD
ncbi:MAG: twitching motility protein PilT [Lentimonas sp.]|jgi:twitching motility protein PilT